jgi:hypothetical protein
MPDYEKLGAFYLGREYDLARKQSTSNLLLYDSKDLVTHAVCVGMTGSGKTGLCVGLLEEAAIDGIPAIVIDPKGDLANLLLTFPSLDPADFRPWINEDDARKKGLSPGDYAAQQAELWRKGLAAWDQQPERIGKLRDSAEFAIYTPGSDAGTPVSALKSFEAPPAEVLEDREALRDRVAGTASSLLGLLGLDADPMQSREHILLSNLLDAAWRDGESLDLPALIARIQSPPFTKIGVMDLDSFFPAKDRFALAMALNNLIASPGFEAWLTGAPLDIGAFLYTPAGKPRVAIFSIAHLSDAERMFFVALLLNQVVSWMRSQSGATSLRAIVYMDEIFGYFPPVADPPSKRPLLTLLKQGRAFGIGVVLATQNPVDLDYKGLANCGTWFIGRLQTERDKARLLDGLQSASGAAFDPDTLSALGNRVFLMNNVHEDGPVVFETRWALSYLRGPLTRRQIKALAPARPPAPPPAPVAANRPVLPPGVAERFLPSRAEKPAYTPMFLGSARIHFEGASKEIAIAAPFDGANVNFDEASEIALDDFATEPEAGASFAELPSSAANPKSYEKWGKAFTSWLYRSQKLELYRCESLKLTSEPGESERDFRIRAQQQAREDRDRRVEELRRKYAAKLAPLEERKRKAEQAVAREKEQAQGQTLQTAISVGSALLGAFLGRKVVSATTLARAGGAIRAAGRSRKESADIGRAEENVASIEARIAELNADFEAEAAALEPATQLETVAVRPKQSQIEVRQVALAWVPRE